LVSFEVSEGSCAPVPVGLRCELGTIRAGGTKLVAIRARASGPPGRLVNVAEATSADPDPDPTNNRDSATVEVSGNPEPSPDLVVQKRASRSTVHVGEPLDYVVQVTNQGNGIARDVVLVDGNSLPTRVLSAQPSAGRCRLVERIVVCQLGDLAPGASAIVRLRAKILRAGPSRNAAAVLPVLGENRHIATADVRVLGGGAALRIEKTADRRTMVVGERITYRIRVTSLGPESARNVRVCDHLPGELKLVRAPNALGPRRVCWTVRELGVGKSHTFRVIARAVSTARRAPNRAFAEASNAGRVRAQRPVRVVFDPCLATPSGDKAAISC
jgi:uncharacterized repeat protein (TIGR01451 family)